MKRVECSNCEKDAKVVRGSYAYKECGLSNVTLQGIELVRCEHCGNEDPIIPRINDLTRGLAVAVISKPYRLQGEDIRFLRKYLRMTGDEFARLIDVDKTTLSKWENNDDPIGTQSDRLVRMMALALGDGLQEKLDEIIRISFPKIRRTQQRVRIQITPSDDMSYRYA